jgi:hypothetical protein
MKKKISPNMEIVDCEGLGFILIVGEFEVHLEADYSLSGIYTQEEMEELQKYLREEN